MEIVAGVVTVALAGLLMFYMNGSNNRLRPLVMINWAYLF